MRGCLDPVDYRLCRFTIEYRTSTNSERETPELITFVDFTPSMWWLRTNLIQSPCRRHSLTPLNIKTNSQKRII